MIADARTVKNTRTSPWVIGIIIGFITLVLVNGAFIYIAVTGADQVVSSYDIEKR
jgi:hypothetical protein